MRHRIKGRKLSRTASHRTATLRALATALIKHKKITTTVAKAKQTRLFAEPLITKAKNDSVHARRLIARHIQDKDVLKELFSEVIPKIGDRPGGYTRIVKLGNRVGDAAAMAIIELVDFNDLASKKPRKTKKKVAEKVEDAIVEKVEESVVEEVKAEVVEDTQSEDSDDLTKVEGIGPKISELLKNSGISTFAKLAETETEKISEILTEAGGSFKSHDPKTWAEQAIMAADGKWDELKKWQDELDGGKEKK
jgi:large subunit ribosomal protein L17